MIDQVGDQALGVPRDRTREEDGRTARLWRDSRPAGAHGPAAGAVLDAQRRAAEPLGAEERPFLVEWADGEGWNEESRRGTLEIDEEVES